MRRLLAPVTALTLACAGSQVGEFGVARSSKSCADVPSVDTTLYEESQVEVKPAVAGSPPLVYPSEARAAGIQGFVVLSAIINPDGRVDSQSVSIERSAHPLLVDEAVRFVLAARFSPACVAGRRVRVHAEIPVEFKIRRR